MTLSYVPGANPIQDAAGNDAAALANEAVTNETAYPMSRDAEVTTAEGVDYIFNASDFPFTAAADGPAALARVKIATLPVAGLRVRVRRGLGGTLTLDGAAIAAADLPKTVTAAELGQGKLAFSPFPGQFGHGYTSFTFRVDDGVVDSEPANTMTVDIAADPAYGELVRNEATGDDVFGGGDTGKALTQGFAIPAGDAGYELRAAGIQIRNAFNPPPLALAIYDSNADGTPKDLVHTLTNPWPSTPDMPLGSLRVVHRGAGHRPGGGRVLPRRRADPGRQRLQQRGR